MRPIFTTAAATAVAALVALPLAAQSATDQAGSQPGSSTTGQSSTATSGTSQSSTSTAKSSDKSFAREAAEGGLAEVELGRLATQKASNDDVKKFGQMMVDDHSKANDQLKPILQQKGISAPESLKGEAKTTHDRLSKLEGEAFDRAYMRAMVEDHEKDVKLFQREAANGSDPELKQFASSTLPTLEKHLQDARQVKDRLSGPAATSGTKSEKHPSGPGHESGTSHRPSTGDSTGSGSNPPTPPQR